MCRNPQKALLLEVRRTAHGVCLLLFERYWPQMIAGTDLPAESGGLERLKGSKIGNCRDFGNFGAARCYQACEIPAF